MKKYLFVINPVAGGHAGDVLRHKLLQAIKTKFPASSYDILLTEPAGPRLPLFDYEAVVVAGGDGTVWQTVQKLMQRRALPRLGVIPVGTGNDLARSSGAFSRMRSQGIAGILDAVQQGGTAAMDILRLNSSFFFTNYYGIGTDATVARAINAFRQGYAGRRREALLHGKFLYVLAGLRQWRQRLSVPVELRFVNAAGNQECLTVPGSGRQIMVTNIASYAAGARPSSRCRMDDKLFEVTLVSSTREWLFLHLTRFLEMPLDRVLPGIAQFQARSLTLNWSGSLRCQLDGETFASQKPAPPHTITVAGRLALIVP